MRFLKGCRKRSNEVAESEMKKRKVRRHCSPAAVLVDPS
jgi:hypothetical protein